MRKLNKSELKRVYGAGHDQGRGPGFKTAGATGGHSMSAPTAGDPAGDFTN